MLSPQKGILFCLFLSLIASCRPSSGNDEPTMMPDQPVWDHQQDIWVNLSHAPGPADLQRQPALLYFFNVSDPLSYKQLQELKTCCDEVGIPLIGVHGPRYPYEMDVTTLQELLPEAFDSIPVLHDKELSLMHSMGIRNWGSAVLTDAKGAAANVWMQIPERSKLKATLTEKWESWKTSHVLATKFYQWSFQIPTHETQEITDLRYISSLSQLVLCDRKNHIIIIADTLGHIRNVIGNGRPGNQTGRFELTELYQPEFAVPDPSGRFIYIGLPAQNRIVRADLREKTTEEWLGPQSFNVFKGQGQDKVKLKPNYPAQQFFAGDHCYIYFRGNKLLIDFTEPEKPTIVAGNGAEGLEDGYAETGSLAALSGTETLYGVTWFTDEQYAALRTYDGAKLTTLSGKGSFESGYRDGTLKQSLFQRPTAIAHWGNDLYIADYYNKSLRRISLRDSMVSKVCSYPLLSETPYKICSSGTILYTVNKRGDIFYSVKPDSGRFEPLLLKRLHLLPRFQNEPTATPDTIQLEYAGPVELSIDSGALQRIMATADNEILADGKLVKMVHGKSMITFPVSRSFNLQYRFQTYDSAKRSSGLTRKNIYLKAGQKKGGKNRLILPLH